MQFGTNMDQGGLCLTGGYYLELLLRMYPPTTPTSSAY